MTKKIIAITAILAILTVSMVGCGESNSFLGGSGEHGKNTVRSDEIFVPIEKIRTLNPIVSKDEDTYYVDKMIYEGMFDFDSKLTPVNVLADSYSYDSDGTTLTVNLKQGIKWSDGEELTAADVKFTMDAITAASYTGSTVYAGNISHVQYTKLGKDPYQIIIGFNDPNNATVANLTFPIIAKHQFKSVDAARTADENFVPIGTGPYRVADYNELSHIILKGNEQYHGSAVPQNTLDFQVLPDKKDAINLMGVNNISIAFSKAIDRDTIYTNADVNLVNFPSNEVELVGYNFRTPALQDVRVRKAIASAINTKEIIESAYFKNGVSDDNIYFPDYLNVSVSKGAISYDLNKAKTYLKEANFIDKNGDGKVEDATGQKLSINILVNSEDQSRMAAAQIIKTGLDQLSIQSNIISKDWASYNSDLASGTYDLFVGGYELKENYDLRFLLHTNYGNPIGYSNPELDGLLDKMQSGLTESDRQDTYRNVRKILDNDLPYFCLMYKTYGAIVSPALKGEVHPTFLNMLQGAENWYLMIETQPVNEQEDDDQQE